MRYTRAVITLGRRQSAMSLALSGRQRMASRLQKQTGSVKSLQAIGVLVELGPVLFERNSGFGASTFFLTAQMAIFLITSKFLIDAFAYSENTRAEQLAFQMILTERALEDFRHAKDQAEATAQALSQANNELHRLATTDPLTGAHNRRSLENAAKREIERLHRYGAPCSVITMDLDRFKMVNDTFG